MNEMYAEWLVKRKSPAYTMLLKILMGILCVIAIFLSITPAFGIFGVIILFAVGAGTYFVFRNSEVEYEYLFVTNMITIDRIYGRSKRKKAWEGTMDEVQIVAPTDSDEVKNHETSNMKLLDFSSHVNGKKTYTLISQSGSETVKILFEPNDKLLQCMRMTSPRKVIVDR
ncbi:DUF6106 family protein [Clostridium sp. E02]|uniref:DUF6106 family protein n=1 Tax=Clostridium sp. E02 TaxID=2487134 RepID=UPI000F51DD9A|nr:DUF6106 family protein [Clostridium sp. E02]